MAKRKRSTPLPSRKKVKPLRKSSLLKEMHGKHKGRKKGNQKKESLWDLYRDGLSFSMLSKWIGCRERFRLSAVEGWTSKHLSVPLEFGSCGHSIEEFVESGGAVERINEVVETYYESRQNDKQNPLTDMANQDLIKTLRMVQTVYENYYEYWSETPTYIHPKTKKEYYDNSLNFVYNEEVFNVIHTLPDKRRIKLVGRWDGVFKHPCKRGVLALKENKTKEQINEGAILDGLKKDLQTQYYNHTIMLTEGRNKPCDILYNVIRRPGLRQGKTEHLNDFIDRVDDDIKKRPDHYYMRWNVEMTVADHQDFLDKTLNPLLTQVADWWESIRHDPFEPWTLPDGSRNLLHWERPFGVWDSSMFGSGKGEYWEILYDNAYDHYYQRDVAFPELVD